MSFARPGVTHTCRLAGATPQRLEDLIELNLSDLEQILLFNEARGIELFRIGSSLIPFASHPVNTLRWWRTRARDFDRLGHIARRSRQRLSLHPSPAAASRIDPADFRAVVAALDGPADLMLEAKDKDLALFALRQEAAGREQPVTF